MGLAQWLAALMVPGVALVSSSKTTDNLCNLHLFINPKLHTGEVESSPSCYRK